MKIAAFPIVLLIVAVPAAAEDAAHRADRLYTQQLNRSAAAVVARRDDRNAKVRAGNDAAWARYQRQMAEWRRQVAACQSGDYAACDAR